ncbi:CMP-N,N'-diacetyllegionaminic acid synthase [Roseimaritima multifibrata]|uniref:CMP-N,N'-diacetyllegionaminic acid synthase n=1 Tax=Roseimaritima multifibrata TaxID=1930274 RepID=A0A517MLS5_9BACT|nr:acylneuraminate cytidylyltransferase family protein [Roseimaritima multifibrata]QDS95819.1 CMP-N,N'-diacetyllegionaminic acid synthase [Roseimaritima multifibrata]
MSDTNIAGFIFARGGSKGVVRKNVRMLGGKPLIAHAIEVALESRWLDKIYVSTDCPEIAETAARFGAIIPFMRPPELAADDSPERLAWRHAIEATEQQMGQSIDALVSIPPTAPLRSSDDIDACIDKLLNSTADIVVTAKKAERSPYFNMITLDESAEAHLAAKPPTPIARRQDAPTVYDMTTVAYAARRQAVMEQNSIFEGHVKAVIIPPERAIDIDTEFDFDLAEFLLCRRNKN